MNLYYRNNTMPVHTNIHWQDHRTAMQIQMILKKIEMLDVNTKNINNNTHTNKPLYLISNMHNIPQSHEIQWCDVNNYKVYFDVENNVYYLDGRKFPDYITNILLQKVINKTVDGIVMEKMQLEISTNILSLENIYKRYNTQIQQLLQNNNSELVKTTRMNHDPDKRMLYAILVINELNLPANQLFELFKKSKFCVDILNTYAYITRNVATIQKCNNMIQVIDYIKQLNISVETYTSFVTAYDMCDWYYYMKILQIKNVKSEKYYNDYNLEVSHHDNIHSGNFTIVTDIANSSNKKYKNIDTTTMILQLNDPCNNPTGYFSNFLLSHNIHYDITTPIYGINTLCGFISCFGTMKSNYHIVTNVLYFWQLCEVLEFGIGTRMYDNCTLIFKTSEIQKLLKKVIEKNICYTFNNTQTHILQKSDIKCFDRYAMIDNNLNNIESKLAKTTNNTYSTIITKEFLQKYNCVVTGGAISCLLTNIEFVTNDIDILVLQEKYTIAHNYLSKHADVQTDYIHEKNIAGRRHVFKLKTGFFIDLFCSNLSDVGYMSTIQRFHVSCVRAYYDGINLVALPSYVHCMLSNTIEKTRYISTNHSVLSVYKKYYSRGFNIVFSDRYAQSFFAQTL